MAESVSTPQLRRRTSSCKTCSILVKFSNGVKNLLLPKEATVSDLIEVVKKNETGEFKLIQDSKVLNPDERVTNICKHLVEVSSTTFSVHIDGEDYSFKTVDGYIKFDEFVQKLSEVSYLNMNTLEAYDYHCKGCGRCITKEKQTHQVFQCNCCEEYSLALRAAAAVTPKIVRDFGAQTLQTSSTVKLIVLYWPSEFTPSLNDEAIEGSMEYSWRRLSYVKCRVFITMENGWVPFGNMRYALEQLFRGSRILTLEQWRGTKNDNEVAWAASDDDELVEDEQRRDCVDCNGQVISYTEVKIFRCKIGEGRLVMICGGQRRTVIQINVLHQN